MGRNKFAITRADGRSNSQVICDYIGQNNVPGRIFSYEEVGAQLSVGTDTEYDRFGVQAATRNAGPMLGRVHKRALQNVPNVGYRLALADEHMVLAAGRQDKASRQLKRGFEILRDTRYEEIKDPEVRKATEGQLLIMSALCHQISSHERRINRVENLVNKMLSTATG